VDEATWLSCTDPTSLLDFLRDSGNLSGRKARLFAAACCRHMWDLLDEERRAVEVSEGYADGAFSEEEREQLSSAAREEADSWSNSFTIEEGVLISRVTQAVAYATAGTEVWRTGQAAAEAVAYRTITPMWEQASQAGKLGYDPEHLRVQGEIQDAWEAAYRAELEYQCHLLRDIFGNPFRPPPSLASAWMTWNRGTVRRLAEAAYEQRNLPAGTLDAACLAVLADALEEAGGDDVRLLGHLRSAGPHTRGCFAVDVLLGRE
jgi:hypothetical protein